MSLLDPVTFFGRFLKAPSEVGSLLPSSKSLARAILKHLPRDQKPKRYLEVGAGTGAFTEKILSRLTPNDHLDIVEINPTLCKILRRKFEQVPNVAIHEVSIVDFSPQEPYHAIISGLPLHSLKPQLVRQVLRQFEALTSQGGHVAFFEYMGLISLKRLYYARRPFASYNRTIALKKNFLRTYKTSATHVFFNLMPARTYHCELP